MKTISLKKVSAVAVASLGFGLLSVVPAQAAEQAWTTVLGTATPTVPVVGQPVTIPLKATTVVSTAASESCFTASFGQKPLSTALVDTSLAANITNRASDWATAGAALTQVVVDTTANVLKATGGATAAAVTTASELGAYTFTPDVAGMYKISILGADCGTGTPTFTNTATTDIIINVGGVSATQASAGLGTSTVTAVTGGQATILYQVNAGTAADALINVTSAGVGAITGADGSADESTTIKSGSTPVSYAADTDAGTITRLNGSAADYAAGFQYKVAATQTNNTLTGGTAKSEALTFQVASSVAGTQTVTITGISATTGAPTVLATVTVTWGAAGAVSPTFSTAYLNSGATYTASTPATGVSLTKTYSSTTAVANIGVTLRDANNAPMIGQKLTVSVSGPGAISVTQGAITSGATTAAVTAGLRAVSESSANSTSQWMIGINADGTAGTSTITISVGSTVVATRTLSFYGAAAKITATQNYSIARAGAAGYELGSSLTNTTATTGYVPAVSVYVEDSAANAVAATVTCLPADITVISGCTIAADDNATYGAGTGYYNASVTSAPNGVSGKSTTVVFRTLLSTGAYVTSAPVTFTLGGSVVSTAVTLNKTSYAPGEAMVLTVTTKDASGNPSYDGQGILGSISANKSVGGALPAITKVFAKGTYATSATAPTLFAPALSGAFTISGVSVATTAAPLGVAYSVSASVTDANAGLMTQIDALNAKIVALNALIAKIMKKLGVK